jgi:hypothetical protein
MRVVFPEPFGPKRTNVSPGPRSRSMPRRAHVPRKALLSPRTWRLIPLVAPCATLLICLPYDETKAADDGHDIGMPGPFRRIAQR